MECLFQIGRMINLLLKCTAIWNVYFRLVEQEYAGTAGMIMAFFLVLGIGTGVNFSLALGMIFTEPKV